MYRQWDYDYAAFGSECKRMRKYHNLTQDALAERARCSRATVWKLENGGYCNPRTMVAVSAILGVDMMKYNIIRESEEERTRSKM